jgi:hypothetical protein
MRVLLRARFSFPEDEDSTGQSETLVGWAELAAPATVELFCRANYTHFLSNVGVDGGKWSRRQWAI